MALLEFTTQLEAANSVLGLAQRLGERCLQNRAELAQMSDRERTREELELIEELAARASYGTWAEAIRDPEKAEEQLGGDLTAAVKRAKTRQPLDFLGVLRGLCRGPLPEFFATTADQIELTKGLPIPFATRPLPDKLVGDSTTPQKTLKDGSLLFPLPYDIYTHLPAEELQVVLDFSHGDRLDALTWDEEKKLPLIATLHPIGGGDYEVKDEGDDRFFGVRPASWDIEAVKDLLERARAAGARLAVLPELSLPSPQALEAEMVRSSGSFPQIVVAGSAHHESAAANGGATIRANESRVYLDGECVAVAQKHHAFKTKDLGAKKFDKPQWENLSKEQKTIMVLSGRRTRLAVAICADLLGTEIPRLLVDAGVNLLLAPAMTAKIGSFNPSLTGIAGLCQGVAAIANTRWGDDGMPFLCMCAVPRPDPSEQSAVLHGDGDNPAPDLAILDPNEPLPKAVSWPGRSVDSD